MMKLKKAQASKSFIVIVSALLVIIVIFLLISFFMRSGSSTFEGLSSTLDSFGDCDDDTVPNIRDKCPCHQGDVANTFEGCPSDVEEEDDLLAYACSEEEKIACAEENEE